jgi:phosphoribosylanthranilate isomerase
MPVAIKFCGLTRREDVDGARALGATYAGVIFAGGPRMQTVDAARGVLDGVTEVRTVGVFRKDDVDGMRAALRTLPIEIVQLHGDVTERDVELARAIGATEVWSVARVGRSGPPAGLDALFAASDAVVLDTATASGLGGSGERFDWERTADALAHIPRRARLVLAGGLRAENVAEAIRTLRPDVVDVSSGVESAPGVKDIAMMRRFVDAVRSV